MHFKFMLIISTTMVAGKVVQTDHDDKALVHTKRVGNKITSVHNVKKHKKNSTTIKYLEEFIDSLLNIRDPPKNQNDLDPRNHNNNSRKKSLLENILPMLVIPFLVSSSMVPMMMVSMIGTLLKSALIGKIGIILMLINMFRNRSGGGALSSQNINLQKELAMQHYGYPAGAEYGAYINRKRRKRKTSI